MPPAIEVSSDEYNSEDEIPARKPSSLGRKMRAVPKTRVDDDAMSIGDDEVSADHSAALGSVPDPMDEDDKVENDEGGDEETGEEEYIVERIVEHRFNDDGVCLYLVKWKGYEKKSDLTWEPIEHLEEGAGDILAAYHRKIGGKPVRKTSAKRARNSVSRTPQSSAKTKGRKSNESATGTPTTAEAQVTNWKPPAGSWEEDIQAIDTVEHDDRGLHVFVHWNNGKKSKHPIEQIYKRCPQKMLHFYEQHLVFREGGREAEGSEEEV